MKNETFMVKVEKEPGTPYPTAGQEAKSEQEAIKLAKELAKEYQDELVYIHYYRATDGQHGYLNRDGYGITGKPW